jgi:cephalosporin-C deacetylase-like acetyl esterase
MTPVLVLLAFLQPPVDLPTRMAASLGGLPGVRANLNARVTGAFERPGYRVEKVIFDSLPGFHVTADLYVPTGAPGPFPAVLGAAGHSNNGKAYATYQMAWITLARRGYVVLAYDPPGQGERVEYFDAELGRSRLTPGVAEHNAAGLQCLLTGGPIARYFIWDGIRAFDYLLSRREVDPRRIAVAGNSGGGTQAAYLAVFEPRLSAVISSCYMTRWRELLAGPGPQDAEQIWPDFLKDGYDFIAFIGAYPKRPFLMTTAIRDFFPIAGARATFEAARAAGFNVEYFEYDDTHGWSQPRREAMYRFLDKHFKNSDAAVREAPVVTEPESLLWVTPTGQLASSFGTETIFTLNRARAQEMYPRRKALGTKQPADLRELVAERMGVDLPKGGPPAPRPGHAAVLTLGVPQAEIEQLLQAGFLVTPLNPPKYDDGRLGYSGVYQAAAREWLNGRTLLGWRVKEALVALDKLLNDPKVDPERVMIWGRGNAGVTAMIAAALEPRVNRVMVERGVTSWFSITQWHMAEGFEDLVVPGVLEDFDLPDLVNLIAPRPLVLVDPQTPTAAPAIPVEYPANWVRVMERPEGWPVTKAFAEWLGPAVR